jgi:D-3-phosphoglycerate dehydrogenase
MHIVVPDDLTRSALQLLVAEGWTVDSATGRASVELGAALATADALIVRSATRVTAALIAAAPILRVIARAGSGVDTIDLDAADARGIVVMNAPDATVTSVAELTLAGMLALARHVSAADRSMKDGEWDKRRFVGTELAGKTLGLVGCGRIGSAVARLGVAFGMTVVARDPALSGDDAAARHVELVSLDELCRRADYISLHAPSTPETRRLFDGPRLAACKVGVRLVNTSRGDLVDEAALLAALVEGRVAGAALDVYDPEPPLDRTLASHPAVVATPHLAASTREAQERVGREAAEAVRDFLKTGMARNVVRSTSPTR